MNMKPQSLVELKRNTVTQEIQTHRTAASTISASTEPTIQPYGDPATQSEILVELPGVDDPAHVKQLIGADRAAQNRGSEERRPLEDARKKPSRPKAAFCRSTPSSPNTPRGVGGGGWYLVSRTPVITGQDVRHAQPRYRSRSSRAAGKPALPFRRMARAALRSSPRRTSATGSPWFSTTRSAA